MRKNIFETKANLMYLSIILQMKNKKKIEHELYEQLN